MLSIKIAGKEYEEMNFLLKLLLFLAYPLFAIFIAILVIVLVVPILIFIWIIMLIKLFVGNKKRRPSKRLKKNIK